MYDCDRGPARGALGTALLRSRSRCRRGLRDAVRRAATCRGSSGLACDPHRQAAPDGPPVAKLSLLVIAPAIGNARRRKSTRVLEIRTQACERESARNGNRREAVRRCSIAELAVLVPAPAVGGAAGGDAAGLSIAGEHGCKGDATGH